MTGHHDVVVVTSQAPTTGEALPGPLTALRHAVRDVGGRWAAVPDEVALGDGTRARPPAVDRQASDAIWPTYHDAVQPPVFRPDWQVSHRARNERCARAAARLAAPGATVWIIGHELQQAPALLRAHRPDIRIGFYLPIPFPPVELFMRLPFRDDLLRGLLGADVIGLQTRRDVDNLLRAAQRLLGLSADGDTLGQPDRPISLRVIPTSVDIDDIARRAARPETLAQARDLRARLNNPALLLLSVDPLDHTAGIEHRLHALEHLLTDRQLRAGHTAVIQIALPPQHRAHPDDHLRHRVEQLVAQINGDHGKIGCPAVHYLHRRVGGADLLALYQAADILVATALRDGMNLTAKQFVASRVDNTGAVILSEFSGAAPELRAAHLVNPHDLDDLQATIRAAATEPRYRATDRIKAMRQHLHQHNARSWAETLLSTLESSGRTSRLGSGAVIPASTNALHSIASS
ncbi:alpha,alpha-trehalose-phosphate synthase (UDP-forming) [Actinophytocola sp.]|uniref:alpha,alpha-trehalose-phosphate synthase (UDP-forming) n=1 Tax=Actinophytocola sp. TaxID=1872138 RepID=UPI002D806357|nr:trehalose-6-phosphate synthase [Actinophytocola sp.]HET9142696.1 trehalose-6-phosphate synthase [Actinophytocola sp.]